MANNIYEKVLENVKIVDVISNYIDLIPKGKNFFGICPFHDDTNPSMSVSPERGIFYCFVCKTGGNAIKFVEEYKKISSIDACKEIANKFHIDISEFNTRYVDKNEKYYELMATANKFFKFLMSDENYSKEARNYLSNRGLNDKAIKEFEIGLSPDDNHALSKQLIEKGFLEPDLIINGLKNDENDMFVSRIIVPIKDEQGRTVAFGGRIYKEKDKDLNKYLNSIETPIFKKGETVFNINKAVRDSRGLNYLIINEGYMDVVTASSNGIKNSIALMGTKMTFEQAKIIQKYTKNVIICLDGDEPGIRAVEGVIEKLKEVSINYSVVILPNNMDPDEFIRKNGADNYKKYLETHALDRIGYLYELTKLEYPTINSINVDSFKNKIFSFIKDESSKTTVELYLNRLSQELKVSYNSISQDFEVFIDKLYPHLRRNNNKNNKALESFHVKGKEYKAEKMVIDYAINSKRYFDYIEHEMDSRVFLKDSSLRSLFIEIGDIYDSNSKIDTKSLIDELIKRGIYSGYIYDDKCDFSIEDLKNNVLKTFKITEINRQIEAKKSLLESLDQSSDGYIDAYNALIKEITDLKKERMNI